MKEATVQTGGYPTYRRDRGRGPQRVLHVMTRQRLYLARVKKDASFEQILDHYHVKTRGAGAKRMALCPFHPDTKPSCSIHLERKVFYCFGLRRHGLGARLRRQDRKCIDPGSSRTSRTHLSDTTRQSGDAAAEGNAKQQCPRNSE
jgi:CHC2 zinc finger